MDLLRRFLGQPPYVDIRYRWQQDLRYLMDTSFARMIVVRMPQGSGKTDFVQSSIGQPNWMERTADDIVNGSISFSLIPELPTRVIIDAADVDVSPYLPKLLDAVPPNGNMAVVMIYSERASIQCFY
jgi:hypothetical protein